jgi:predicted nucleotidyltransferase
MKNIRLTRLERQALQDFVRYLHETCLAQVQTVALFGSKARGDSHQDSDIDVLVILSVEDRPLRRAILKQAARISLAYDVLLSPRVIGAERWSQMHGFSLYRNVASDATSLDMVGGKLTLASAGIAL